jgi:hypothetical protein
MPYTMITKSERVALVATKKELAAWKVCADEAGLSLSEWIRRAAGARILHAARRPDGAVDLDRLIALCRERSVDVEQLLRDFAGRGQTV